MPISEIQPSQLFVNRAKLYAVQRQYDVLKLHQYDPIPIKELDGRMVFTDGHSRAFAVHLNGGEEIKVAYEQDELNWDAYRICVNWCVEEEILTVAGLKGRLLDPADYEEQWIRRCERINSGSHRREHELAIG